MAHLKVGNKSSPLIIISHMWRHRGNTSASDEYYF